MGLCPVIGLCLVRALLALPTSAAAIPGAATAAIPVLMLRFLLLLATSPLHLAILLRFGGPLLSFVLLSVLLAPTLRQFRQPSFSFVVA